MSYIPTPEKMSSLGFDNKFQLGPRIFLGSMKESGYIKVVLPLDGYKLTKLIVADGDEDVRRMSFDLPSEKFFEQLLLSVGVKFRPPSGPTGK